MGFLRQNQIFNQADYYNNHYSSNFLRKARDIPKICKVPKNRVDDLLIITMNQEANKITALFTHTSDISKYFVGQLVVQSFEELGQKSSLDLMEQWKILSQTLNTATKISSLRDKNHRALIIQFIKAEAAKFYKSSYFNHAKIDVEYLSYLQRIGPFEFAQIIAIVNKLKLIQKHHRERMEAKIFTESHIEAHIRKIMELCQSPKRSINSNLNKFKAIVEFEDRIELIKELGKLLRQSWSSEKKIGKNSAESQYQGKTLALESATISEPQFQNSIMETMQKNVSQLFFDDYFFTI